LSHYTKIKFALGGIIVDISGFQWYNGITDFVEVIFYEQWDDGDFKPCVLGCGFRRRFSGAKTQGEIRRGIRQANSVFPVLFCSDIYCNGRMSNPSITVGKPGSPVAKVKRQKPQGGDSEQAYGQAAQHVSKQRKGGAYMAPEQAITYTER